MNTDQLIQFTGAVELQAAKDKPKKLRILAYTGGVMDVAGYGPTLIDLSRLNISKVITILDGHQNTLDATLGSGRASVTKGRLYVAAQLANTDAANTVLELLDTGVQLQASVGVRPGEVSELSPGTEVTANGRTIKTDRYTSFIKSGILEEVSILPMGADGETEISLAARRAAHSNGGKQNMEPTENTTPDLVQAERNRITEIDSLLGDWPAERSQAIKAGWTIDQARDRSLHLLRASRPTAPAIFVNGGTSDVAARSVIASAILLRAGRSDVALKHFGDRAVNSADSLRCNSLFDICRASLRLVGHDDWNSGDRDQVIRAGLSTTSFPVGLSDAINKMALTQYQQAPGSWRLFARVTPLNDFHPSPHIRPHFGGSAMPKLPPGGEIKHSNATEEVFTVSADTFAEMLSVDRRDIINDNVGLFTQFSDALARKAASTVSDIVWAAILGNANDFFGTDNANLITGGTSALSIDSLSAAITKMRKQADASGKPIDIVPRTLVVPPELEGLGRQIINSTEVLGDGSAEGFGSGTGSPLPRDLQLGVEARASSAAFTGNSTTAWYLFASPNDSPVVVGFLNGVESPTIETVDSGPNVLGMTMRGYIDAGVALGDFRAAVKSNGV